jgi:gamma-glutamyltranspeptidase/glutathione hydrolase
LRPFISQSSPSFVSAGLPPARRPSSRHSRHRLNMAEAENAPRARDRLFPDELRIERGISPDTIRLLEAMGHKVVLGGAMGSANTILRAPDGELTGASDLPQSGMQAVGY